MASLVVSTLIFLFFRSNPSGNCLFSSVSLELVGINNNIVSKLRILTAVELFTNSLFYCRHPLFSYILDQYPSYFSSLNNIFKMSLSLKTVDSDLSSSDAVEAEALNICCDKQWSSFICVLALSSVIVNHKIISYYPDFGSIKHKLLYNQHIDPRPPLESSNSSPVINILFCREGPMTSGHEFIPNHFVPLVCATPVLKRKCSQSSTGVIPKNISRY